VVQNIAQNSSDNRLSSSPHNRLLLLHYCSDRHQINHAECNPTLFPSHNNELPFSLSTYLDCSVDHWPSELNAVLAVMTPVVWEHASCVTSMQALACSLLLAENNLRIWWTPPGWPQSRRKKILGVFQAFPEIIATEILAIWQHLGQFLAIFSPHMRRNAYFSWHLLGSRLWYCHICAEKGR